MKKCKQQKINISSENMMMIITYFDSYIYIYDVRFIDEIIIKEKLVFCKFIF